ncbi:MAG: hypothetical protein J5985_03735 [Kiritimatiellae bacterium]|nr:hypothetical protein [Kiritimatiellia bacterium]
MSFSSKFILLVCAFFACLFLAGCMANVQESELPWSTPSSSEGTIPLPSSMRDRFD